MAKKNYYDEDFKRTLVELYHNGKTQASLIKESQRKPQHLLQTFLFSAFFQNH